MGTGFSPSSELPGSGKACHIEALCARDEAAPEQPRKLSGTGRADCTICRRSEILIPGRTSDWSDLLDICYADGMKTIPAAKFKEQCLAILDNLEPDGVVVTKHGKPVATVTPFHRSGARLIGSLKGKIKINGDIMSTGIRWNAGD